jgi:hypothetical protein
LNDSTELRYASKHFQQALRARREAITSSGLAADLVDGALKYFKEDPDFPFQAGVGHFVTCFSEKQAGCLRCIGQAGSSVDSSGRGLLTKTDEVLRR